MTNQSRERPRTLLSWSSGKDSAWTLHVLRQREELEVIALVTTVNQLHERVAMHAVRRTLLAAQAEAAGLPLWEIAIPSPCSNAEYETAMRGLVERAVHAGVTRMAFGDLFLEDVRRYREEQLRGTGIEPVFPLWQSPTAELATAMLSAGVRAHVTCVDPAKVPKELCGRPWDAAFLAALPAEADPCGENGEFHTFVSDGPMLRRSLPVRAGEIVERDGFVFSDLTL